MQNFSNHAVIVWKNLFIWESADLVMSWHAPCLQKWKRKHFFCYAPSTPPLKSANCPILPPPFSLRTPSSFKNQIFQWTPIIKLKVTKFLFKLSQFNILVNTDQNVFVYKLSLSLNISDFSLIFMRKLSSRKRGWYTMLRHWNYPLDRLQ